MPAVGAYGGDDTSAWFAGSTASGARVAAHVVERFGPDRLDGWVDGEPLAGAGDASEGVVTVASG